MKYDDYLNEIETYLYPLIDKFLPHLSDYFVELVADARQFGQFKFEFYITPNQPLLLYCF